MIGSRSLPWLLVLALLPACTRENPAFEDGLGDELEDTRGETNEGASDEVADTGSSSDATDETQADASSESDEATTEAQGCGLEKQDGLTLIFGERLAFEGQVCPQSIAMQGLLEFDEGAQALVLKRCVNDDLLCLDANACGYEKYIVKMPFDVGVFAPGCVTVHASSSLGSIGEECSWGAFSMFPGGNTTTPLVVASTRGAPVTATLTELFAGFPQLEEVATCDCEAVGVGEPCCLDGGASFHGFVIPDYPLVVPPMTIVINIPFLPYSYKFIADQAQQFGSCTMQVETSWALRADF